MAMAMAMAMEMAMAMAQLIISSGRPLNFIITNRNSSRASQMAKAIEAEAESIKPTSNGRTQQARIEISKDCGTSGWHNGIFVNKNEPDCAAESLLDGGLQH